MIVLISKKQICALLLLVLLTGAAALGLGGGAREASGTAGMLLAEPIYVVDPGHGGEDGGAVAGDGTVESHINLAIALRLNDVMRFCGKTTCMTRREDKSIYSDGASTLREKKVSDLKNRVAMVNSNGNAVLVSIHQNKMPEAPRVHGAQAFYNSVDGAASLAKQVQSVLNEAINTGNAKTEKQISSTIYLMKHVTAPAVLIECGFLSNPDETAALQKPEYQLKLAAAITSGLLNRSAEAEKPTPAEET